ncbi:neuronal acetylcholine receptor subunit alpha-5 [Ostrinia furnacalis]|uniref:neuronal acetylcholine receptor subunit alpha-5 n=1 Tax=Ostrinia furnacalis TaxID=93504 RepID=UPI00103DFC47|nr:neuronal acetylcholine receptor subunit alpha-5 [Ostrinia furnacalis]
MKWLLSLFLFVIGVHAQESNFTFTYEMATHCKEHICQRGYSYDTYYSVDAEDRKNYNSDGVTFEMHIAIQAGSNGHILLSSVAYPDHNDPVYEIVVGGGGNKFTELRRNLKRNAKASSVTVGILSAVELRGFYIRLKDNLIEFSREGATAPIIKYYDVSPLDIKFFSFAAWNGVEAKFLYDCPRPGEGSNETRHSKEIKRRLSDSEQLKEDLLKYRSPNMAPGPNVSVSVHVNITGLKYNAFESKLTTGISLITFWIDENLAWEPSKFNNVSSVSYRQGQIWRPMFQVYNADNLDALKTIGHELIWVYPDGYAIFHSKATIDSWCFTETTIYNSWPHDSYSCSIVIQPWEAHETIFLSILTYDMLRLAFIYQDDLVENEWEVTKITQFIVPAVKWYRMYPRSKVNTTHHGDRLVLNLDFQRKPTNYNIVFYTPLLVLVTFVLMSFWNKPLQMSRVWFYAGATILICIGLCYIEYMMPCHTIPTILVLYITVLGGILLAMLLQVIMMTSVAERLCKTMVMQNLLSAYWFRAVCCLPVIKICRNYNTINEGYSTQDDEDYCEIDQGKSNVEEMQTEANKYCEKEEFAEVVDKILFVVYSVTFAVMLGLHY